MSARILFDATIPSDISRVTGFVAAAIGTLSALSLDEGIVFNVKLCLHEAVVNAIKHGNHSRAELSVHVVVKVHGDELTFEVSDQGQGFDHHALPDPTSEDNIGKYHGRGIYLMMHIMDRVVFFNGGRSVRMVKAVKGGK
ncbi:MAG: ATP-binding protein [Candidatus Omnitrophica bacterium]|nr:ATP-binding protein [Candidatus Omnitrophota bacterium]